MRQNQLKIPSAYSEGQAVTVVSLFRYEGWHALWGMRQLYEMRARLRRQEGLRFFKLVGSGSGIGFSIKPDLSTYGLITVWESLAMAEDFFAGNIYRDFEAHSAEQWSLYMQAYHSRGAWSRQVPFDPQPKELAERPISVITRATVKARHIPAFWATVPSVSNSLEGREGLLFAKGVGEVPLKEQVTFSLWREKEAMEAFAFEGAHDTAIMKVRRNGWFKEELFAQFLPFHSRGSIYGRDALGEYLATQ